MTDGEVAETDVVLRRVVVDGDMGPPVLNAEPREDSEDMAEDLLAKELEDA